MLLPDQHSLCVRYIFSWSWKLTKLAGRKDDRISQYGKHIHNDKKQVQFHSHFSSSTLYKILVRPSSGHLFSMLVLFTWFAFLELAPLSLTGDCTDEPSSACGLEVTLILPFKNELDCFGLRLQTPLCPIFFLGLNFPNTFNHHSLEKFPSPSQRSFPVD